MKLTIIIHRFYLGDYALGISIYRSIFIVTAIILVMVGG